MVTEDHSKTKEPPTPHADEEWEAQRSNFENCYIHRKLSLKDATSYMVHQFGFHATKRQWERKAKEWKLFKYVSPETRWRQLEGGQLGDRNLSRFVRRHRSPSPNPPRQPAASRFSNRSRAKSTSAIGTPGYDYLDPTVLERGQQNSYAGGRDLHNSQSDTHLSPQSPTFADPFAGSVRAPSHTSEADMRTDTTYNLFLSDEVLQELNSLPDHFPLDATRADSDSDSPLQLHVVTDPNAATSAPEVHLTFFDDYSAQLLPAIPLDVDAHVTNGLQIRQAESPSTPRSAGTETASFYRQSESSFEMSSTVSGGEQESAFQMDPAFGSTAESSWSDGLNISEQDASQGQNFSDTSYNESQSSSDPIPPHQGLSQTYMPEVEANAGASGPSAASDYQTLYMNQLQNSDASRATVIQDEQPDMMRADPHGLETDFLLSIGDYATAIKEIVVGFARESVDPTKLKELQKDLMKQRSLFSDEVRVRLENLIASLKRINQSDRDMVSRARQRMAQQAQIINQHAETIAQQSQTIAQQNDMNALYRQMLADKGCDIERELSIRAGYLGPLSMQQVQTFTNFGDSDFS